MFQALTFLSQGINDCDWDAHDLILMIFMSSDIQLIEYDTLSTLSVDSQGKILKQNQSVSIILPV